MINIERVKGKGNDCRTKMYLTKIRLIIIYHALALLDAIASVELYMSVTQSMGDHLSKSSSVYGLKHREMF